MNSIVLAILVLGALGLVCAALLYVVARRFRVDEDPRIAQVEALLPGANCGGCGFSGCHDFACKVVAADTMEGFNCPGAGSEGMQRIALLLGRVAGQSQPVVAVVKCNGTCDLRPAKVVYDGARTCAIAAMSGAGEGGCPNGCLGCGDCVAACKWGAIAIDPATGLPVVDDTRCTGCNQCALSCPRHIIEMQPKGPGRGLRVWVACSNTQKGAVALKACKSACIACGKCARACPFEAITIADNLSRIDPAKCRKCRKCVDECPTHVILTANFPVKKTPAPQEEAAR